jgi:ABC-2 type transport system ATP-binding protein
VIGTAVALEARGLTKRFKGEVLAVDHLDISVPTGEVCGLLGPNGAGKTTTLRMMLGLIRPDEGEASVLGEIMRPSHPVLARVGTLIERPGFVPHLSGMTNLRLFWRSGGGSWPAPHLDRALDVAGLGSAVDRKVKGYSQGMRQRLGIAQALLGQPEVLVLDEPTNGLDPQEMREMRRLIREMAGEGATVLLSSHLLAEVEQVCHQVIVMDKGRLVSTGSVSDLVGHGSAVYLEVGDVARAVATLEGLAGVVSVAPEGEGLTVATDGIPRSALVKALVRARVAVETVTTRNRLEDAFLDLLGDDHR